MLLFSNLGQHEPVFHSAAAFQNIRIVWRVVTFTNDFRGAELELWRESSGACPLNVGIVVVAPRVLAAHDVDLVEAARVAADAFELIQRISPCNHRFFGLKDTG